MLRLIIGRSGDPAVRMERCKLPASGCQLIAIGVLASALIELLALRIMGYVSTSPSSEDRGMAELLHGFLVSGGAFAVVVAAGSLSSDDGSACRTAGSRVSPLTHSKRSEQPISWEQAA